MNEKIRRLEMNYNFTIFGASLQILPNRVSFISIDGVTDLSDSVFFIAVIAVITDTLI